MMIIFPFAFLFIMHEVPRISEVAIFKPTHLNVCAIIYTMNGIRHKSVVVPFPAVLYYLAVMIQRRIGNHAIRMKSCADTFALAMYIAASNGRHTIRMIVYAITVLNFAIFVLV